MVVASIAARCQILTWSFGDDISEDMFSDCVMCACAQDASNSLLLPCCGNRHWVHTGCLIRSVEFCGLRCPFCSTYLDESESHPSLSALRALDPSSGPVNAELASVIRPLCCHRVGPYPEFALLDDMRMEWSPIAPSSRGGSWGSRSGCVEVVQGQCNAGEPHSSLWCRSMPFLPRDQQQHFCFACWQPVVGGLTRSSSCFGSIFLWMG